MVICVTIALKLQNSTFFLSHKGGASSQERLPVYCDKRKKMVSSGESTKSCRKKDSQTCQGAILPIIRREGSSCSQ